MISSSDHSVEHKQQHDNPAQHTLQHTGPTSSQYDLTKGESTPYSSTDKEGVPEGAAAPHDPHHHHHAAVHSIFGQLDSAGISWFHVKTVIVAGMGFFCDSYDLFSISLVTKTIGRIYYPDQSYNCVPCADQSNNPLSTSCLKATSGSNCLKILNNLGITNATDAYAIFNTGFDNRGNGWGDTQINSIQGNAISGGNHNIWNKVIGQRPSGIPTNTNNALLAVALCGTLVGQLLFGYLGDKFGRRNVFAITLYIMITACAAQAFSFGSSATGVIATLCFFRFCLGMGVGGDYPLSATLMSEYSGKNNRGSFIGAVFAMQGIGYLAAATVAIIFSSIWNASDNANPDHLWRIILSFGAIPTAATLYARLNLPETPRYTTFVQQNASQLVEDMNFVLASERARQTGEVVALPSSLSGVPQQNPAVRVQTSQMTYSEFFRKYWLTLVGTASTWFLLDIAFYSQNLTQSSVFTAVKWLPDAFSMSISEEAYRIARAQAIVALSSTVPGYWMTVLTVEYLGRWKIQAGGFLMMTLFMAILAGDYNNLVNNNVPAFVAMYCMTFFFANWGPNSTTFIIPAEVFPTQYRTTGHGISAAWGKAGAIIGTFGFSIMQTNVSTQAALGLLCGINGAGFLCTFLVPETKGKSLEELSDDRILPAGKQLDTSDPVLNKV